MEEKEHKTLENKSVSMDYDKSYESARPNVTPAAIVDSPTAPNNQSAVHQLANSTPRALQLKANQELANDSLQSQEAMQFYSIANGASGPGDDAGDLPQDNNTGLPDNLKSGIESLSGISLDGVKVHRNSDKPAQLQAHAYAQGEDIHLGPGQEKHLPHEAWHIVQQKQGRVKPTMQMKGKVNVNDDAGLEKEADVMGAKALSGNQNNFTTPLNEATKLGEGLASSSSTVQLMGEKDFNKDPSGFMDANQLLVAFDEGVNLTYEVSEEVLEAINDRQSELSDEEMKVVNDRRKNAKDKGIVNPDDDFGKSVALRMKSPEAIGRKKNNYIVQIMEEAMKAATCEFFTLAVRKVSRGLFSRKKTQYIVTPMLESLKASIGADVMTTSPNGEQISLLAALNTLSRVQENDGIIKAAYIPYESNPGLMTEDTNVNIESNGPINIAFTAAMNGCSIACKRTAENQITAWHFPSPDSNQEKWDTFLNEQQIEETYNWESYNGLPNDELYSRSNVTSTVMIRDENGWKVKSQQNIGPVGDGQDTKLLEIGKIFEHRLFEGEEIELNVEDGIAVEK